jgi:predicted molibdopterin-dependent oxidoreductase YjgC
MTNPDSAPSVNTLADTAKTGSELFIDGKAVAVPDGELLLEAILREKQILYACYHSPLMGPIRSCNTCLVEVNGKLERACGMEVSPGLQVVTSSDRATSARSEAFDVILTNHMGLSYASARSPVHLRRTTLSNKLPQGGQSQLPH